MAVAVAITSISADPSGGLDKTMNEQLVEGTLTLSSNYGAVAGHGDVVSFAGFSQIQSNQIPRRVEVFEDQGAGNAPLGYSYLYFHGTTLALGKLVILGTSAAGGAKTGTTEFTNGDAYSTGTPSLNGAVLRFRAWFPLFL